MKAIFQFWIISALFLTIFSTQNWRLLGPHPTRQTRMLYACLPVFRHRTFSLELRRFFRVSFEFRCSWRQGRVLKYCIFRFYSAFGFLVQNEPRFVGKRFFAFATFKNFSIIVIGVRIGFYLWIIVVRIGFVARNNNRFARIVARNLIQNRLSVFLTIRFGITRVWASIAINKGISIGYIQRAPSGILFNWWKYFFLKSEVSEP